MLGQAVILSQIISALRGAATSAASQVGKLEALQELKERFRIEFISHFTKNFTKEMEHNLDAYVRSLSLMDATAELPRDDIEQLNFKFNKFTYDFQKIFETKLKNSPILEEINNKISPRGDVNSVSSAAKYVISPRQKFPHLAWVNKAISPPNSYQPMVLLKSEDLDDILQKVLDLYDSIDLDNL